MASLLNVEATILLSLLIIPSNRRSIVCCTSLVSEFCALVEWKSPDNISKADSNRSLIGISFGSCWSFNYVNKSEKFVRKCNEKSKWNTDDPEWAGDHGNIICIGYKLKSLFILNIRLIRVPFVWQKKARILFKYGAFQ